MSIDQKLESQFAKYLKKVIHNTATNYYKKKYRYQKYELLIEDSQDYRSDVKPKDVVLPATLVFGYPMVLEDEKIINAITKLKEREQVFLLEKFLLGKTDKEIGKTFGITRQGVTNLKHRTYKKIRNEYNQKSRKYL